ncbi:hypothetical protein F511_36068 [Dorcoceras hygrometricum]|uniref:Uncharacterized protein n=1 Tax=Dorcoceras hygrometricum TaxID=472368 RepID=A0A2Z7CVK6_9LAMI|nr:hypothetical protein F511_36068 [Dorcoceras hygrometricum]
MEQHKTYRLQGAPSWSSSVSVESFGEEQNCSIADQVQHTRAVIECEAEYKHSDRVQTRSQAVRRTQLSNQLKDHLGGQLRYTSYFSERLDELEKTTFDGDEEESVCSGYSISLHRAKLAWKNASWISTSHQLSIDPEEL